MDDIELEVFCPYCYHDNTETKAEKRHDGYYIACCNKCQESFEYTKEILIAYEPRKLTCLSGGNHNHELVDHDGRRAWQCEYCDEIIVKDCLHCDIKFPNLSLRNYICSDCKKPLEMKWSTCIGGKQDHMHFAMPVCSCSIIVTAVGGGGGWGGSTGESKSIPPEPEKKGKDGSVTFTKATPLGTE